MKKNLTFFALALFASGAYCQTIPNGDFEAFTGNEPDGWFTLNVTSPLAPLTTSSTDAHGGSLAVLNQPQTVFNVSFYPILSLGTNDSGLVPVALGGNFNAVQGWIKSNLGSADEVITITQSTFTDETGSGIAGGSVYSSTTSANEWTYFQTIPFTNQGAAATHYSLIAIMSNSEGENANLDSFFMLDDLSLSNTIVGVDEFDVNPELLVYPNPAHDKVHLHFKNNTLESAHIRMIDSMGKIVQEITPNSGHFHAGNFINTSGLSAGIYTLSATTKNGTTSQRIIIK